MKKKLILALCLSLVFTGCAKKEKSKKIISQAIGKQAKNPKKKF